MDCSNPKVRKQLREYAADMIVDKAWQAEMEAHIETCAVCKHELYLWQELRINQATMTNNMADASLRARVKQHMKAVNKDPNIPRFIKNMDFIGKTFLSPKGCLLTQIVIVMFGFLWVWFTRRQSLNIAYPILIVISFIALFVLLLRKK